MNTGETAGVQNILKFKLRPGLKPALAIGDGFEQERSQRPKKYKADQSASKVRQTHGPHGVHWQLLRHIGLRVSDTGGFWYVLAGGVSALILSGCS